MPPNFKKSLTGPPFLFCRVCRCAVGTFLVQISSKIHPPGGPISYINRGAIDWAHHPSQASGDHARTRVRRRGVCPVHGQRRGLCAAVDVRARSGERPHRCGQAARRVDRDAVPHGRHREHHGSRRGHDAGQQRADGCRLVRGFLRSAARERAQVERAPGVRAAWQERGAGEQHGAILDWACYR